MDTVFATTINLDPDLLRKLRRRSDVRGWLQVGSHLGALAISTVALSRCWGSWWAVPAFAVQGILINCLYAGVHELSHSTVFRTRVLNEVFGRLFAFVLLMGRDQDRFEHFQHHRHTQDPALDAEIAGTEPFTLRTYLLYLSGLTYWPARIAEVVRLALGQADRWPHLAPGQHDTVHREARVMLAGYLVILVMSIATGSAAALLYWLLPMLAMKWFQTLQNLAEHTAMPHEADTLRNTRTLRTNALMRWLLWNMPYHAAHHSYPMVPFHQLPKLHTAVCECLGEQPPTISHFGFQKHMLRKLVSDGTSRYMGRDLGAY